MPATGDPLAADPDDPGDHDRGDRELLAAHVAGDPDAFGTLFARHRDRLWAVALRTTGDPEEAADALQDAMVAAFRRAGSFRGDSAVTTWLHRVVVNACLDRLRRRKVRTADPLPDQPEDHQDRTTLAVGENDDPSVAAERSELRRSLRSALDRLPVDQRVALLLVDVQGYSVEEASRLLDAAPGTVKSRCSRGRARLRLLLGEAGITPGNRAGPQHVPSRTPGHPPGDPPDHPPTARPPDPTRPTRGGGR